MVKISGNKQILKIFSEIKILHDNLFIGHKRIYTKAKLRSFGKSDCPPCPTLAIPLARAVAGLFAN